MEARTHYCRKLLLSPFLCTYKLRTTDGETKYNPWYLLIQRGETRLSYPKLVRVVCSYNAYSFSSAFHIQTSKHYLGAQQVRSQHLVSRILKLG